MELAVVEGRKLSQPLQVFETLCLRRIKILQQAENLDVVTIALLHNAVQLAREASDTAEATLVVVADALLRREFQGSRRTG